MSLKNSCKFLDSFCSVPLRRRGRSDSAGRWLFASLPGGVLGRRCEQGVTGVPPSVWGPRLSRGAVLWVGLRAHISEQLCTDTSVGASNCLS